MKTFRQILAMPLPEQSKARASKAGNASKQRKATPRPQPMRRPRPRPPRPFLFPTTRATLPKHLIPRPLQRRQQPPPPRLIKECSLGETPQPPPGSQLQGRRLVHHHNDGIGDNDDPQPQQRPFALLRATFARGVSWSQQDALHANAFVPPRRLQAPPPSRRRLHHHHHCHAFFYLHHQRHVPSRRRIPQLAKGPTPPPLPPKNADLDLYLWSSLDGCVLDLQEDSD